MLKYRLISFPLLIALGALMFLWDKGGFFIYTAVAPVALGLAVYEAAAMLEKSNFRSFSKAAGIAAALAGIGVLNLHPAHHMPGSSWGWETALYLAAALILPAFILIFRKPGMPEKVLGTAAVLLIFGLPLLLAVSCWNLTIGKSLLTAGGVPALLFLIAVSKSMDTGGYIFGMLSGRYLPGGNHKIAPTVSPKKSWEGFFGGLALTLLAACCFHWWGGVKLNWCLVTGCVLGVGSFFGDLTESALKRYCNIKDSGNYIPGMGGALDVLDSFIYNGALLLIMILVFYERF